ncbi:ABC transporter substrate-binding protein [Wenjunlia tyrosinilytica]|uniref:ABC transporter substrate-binding protein n=1 Tax=Wenjunlia tyrosinilytica TaxID=1544741 RepID=A0A917ZVG6_9ACTN|nr:ABC transporter substrate-binding protein [Wenjunlia tyrosinilytica]GGO92312.1 ABC transporter substrate-binding protein [Wenjunlia tyrosinilytica]
MGTTRIVRGARIFATCGAAALVLTACGSNSGSGGGDITLTVADFGGFGYDKLIKDYEKSHPGIKVKEKVAQFDPHHQQLSTQLAAGAGAADVVAIEEGYLPKFRQSKDKFVNLADHGADKLKDRWLPWKWEQGVTDNGKYVLGYGTDIGSLAMCYNTELFKKAGLPTDRDKVSALWTTWDDYLGVGHKFVRKVKGAGWYDTDQNLFTAIMNQTQYGFFDQDDKFIGDTNPKVKEAFLQAGKDAKKLSAKLLAFSPQWSAGIKKGAMATIPCPSWMNGLIETAAGKENSGKWDIAKLPGDGGNWGGSFLTVPKQGKHPKEAAELAAWLTAPEQEKRLFAEVGALPSQPALLKDPAILGKTRPFFNNAPVGKIYGDSATALQPNYRGSRDGDIRPGFSNALIRVEQGKQSPEASFNQAIKEAKKALKLG